VWDAGTMATLSVLKGEHSRGVCAVSFSGEWRGCGRRRREGRREVGEERKERRED